MSSGGCCSLCERFSSGPVSRFERRRALLLAGALAALLIWPGGRAAGQGPAGEATDPVQILTEDGVPGPRVGEEPPNCNGNALFVEISRPQSSVCVGTTIPYRITIQNTAFPSCRKENIVVRFWNPDNNPGPDPCNSAVLPDFQTTIPALDPGDPARVYCAAGAFCTCSVGNPPGCVIDNTVAVLNYTPATPGTKIAVVCVTATSLTGIPPDTFVARPDITTVVNALPACDITGPASICAGGSAQYCAPEGANLAYLWEGAGVNGLTTRCVSVSTAGEYCVTVTNTQSNCTKRCCKTLATHPCNPCELQACSPGYWRHAHHFPAWCQAGYNPTNDHCFDGPDNSPPCEATGSAALVVDAFQIFDFTAAPAFDKCTTLLTAVNTTGGDFNQALFHGTASLLNASAFPAAFGHTPDDVRIVMQQAFAGTITFAQAHNIFAGWIAQEDIGGCPCGRDGCEPDAISNPTCTVGGEDEMCADDEPTEFCAVVVGGTPPYHYQWEGPPGFVPPGDQACTGPINIAGVYKVDVKDSVGCATDCSRTLTVNPNPTCTVDPPTVCPGGQLCVVPSGGTPPYSYAWTGPGSFVADTACINPVTPGQYKATVTDSKGCRSAECSGTATACLKACSPGYWKHAHHFPAWCQAGYNPIDDRCFDGPDNPAPCQATGSATLFVDAFQITDFTAKPNYDKCTTLLKAVNTTGGSFNQCCFHGTAALLNASAFPLEFGHTPGEVRSIMQQAFAGTISFAQAHNIFAGWIEQESIGGCPCNRNGCETDTVFMRDPPSSGTPDPGSTPGPGTTPPQDAPQSTPAPAPSPAAPPQGSPTNEQQPEIVPRVRSSGTCGAVGAASAVPFMIAGWSLVRRRRPGRRTP